MEGAPLLAADPPIDDDSYNVQPQSLPSLEQKHLLYAWHVLSTALSGSSQYGNILLIALQYRRDFIPITVFAIVPLMMSNLMEDIASNLVDRARLQRLVITTGATVGERLCQVLFCTLLLHGVTWKTLLLCIILSLTQRILRFVVRQSLEFDWALILANDQPTLHRRVTRHLNDISYRLSVIVPVVTAFAVQYVGVEYSLRLLRIASLMIVFVELAMIQGLYGTCYALRLPTSYTLAAAAVRPERTERDPWTFAWSRSSIIRILKYIRRVPRPVCATFGVICMRSSLLTIGPHVTWYLLHEDVAPLIIGTLRTIMAVDMLSESIPPVISASIVALGSCICALTVGRHPIFFGCAALVSRLGVRKMNDLAQSIVEDSGIDESAIWYYNRVESFMLIVADIIMFSLTLIWSDAIKFFWPVYISATVSLIGLGLLAGARFFPKH